MLDSAIASPLNSLQGEKAPNPLKLAILPVSLEAVQGALYLPKGYQFVSVVYDEQYRVLKFLVSSEELPEVKEGCALPTAQVHVRVEIPTPEVCESPDLYLYRKISTEIKVI